MNNAIYTETLKRLESSLFGELFKKNFDAARILAKKQQSILKPRKVVKWLFTPIDSLNISKNIKTKLKSKDLETIEDLLYLLPLRVEDYTLKNPVDVKDSEYGAFKGVVISKNSRPKITSIIINSNGAHIRCNYFNLSSYLKKIISSIKIAEEIVCMGKVSKEGLFLVLNHPKILKKNQFQEQIDVIYPAVSNLKNSSIKKAIAEALKLKPKEPFDYLPYNIILKNKLPLLSDLFEMLHSKGVDEKILKRLKYEEIFLAVLALRLHQKQINQSKSIKIDPKPDFLETVEDFLPFSLTNDQKKAIFSILKGLNSSTPMMKLLQGDVGCGKTIVALIAALAVGLKGFQTAIMAPTQPLAKQFFLQAKQLFEKFSLKTELLISSTKNKEKIYSQLKNGSISCIIGTHALLEESIVFKNLAFIVIDEQHRFGVEQRKTLTSKGLHPHILIMSATPIPRSLSMVLYSKNNLITIKQKPKGRGKIKTMHLKQSKEALAYNILKEQLHAGHQAYIVAPLIEESSKMDEVASAETLFNEIADKLEGFNVALLHGRMKDEQKQAAIDGFRSGKINCLVSTTVIEVGIDSPNATVIIVKNAERFGLAQLHQLRGRVGRGKFDSYAIFITPDNISEKTKKRIEVLLKTNDGFKIAQLDFMLRGSGDIFGTRQHGKAFNYINIIKDKKLIEAAKNDVEQLVEKGYPFSDALKDLISNKWSRKLSYIKVV